MTDLLIRIIGTGIELFLGLCIVIFCMDIYILWTGGSVGFWMGWMGIAGMLLIVLIGWSYIQYRRGVPI